MKMMKLLKEGYNELTKLFGKYIDKFNKNDKFTAIGYNVKFDMDFLSNFFKKNNDKFFGSWISWYALDPMQICFFYDFIGILKLNNYKLGTVCEHFGIELDAHDALNDIRATREVMNKLKLIALPPKPIKPKMS